MKDLYKHSGEYNDNNVIFADGIITVIIQSKIKVTNLHGEKIHLQPKYDEPISLAQISKKYPTVAMVIHETALKGNIYRRGNHVKGEWELIGETVGYA